MLCTTLVWKVTFIEAKLPSTTGLINNLQYNADKQNQQERIESIDEDIPNSSYLFKKTDYNIKIKEI